MFLRSKLSKNFESPKRLYNIARRDIVVLKKNNAELIAKILIKSHYDEKTICLMINKYLEGIDFETNKKTIEDEELEFLEPMHPLCFLGEAHHILERICK